MRLCQKSIKRSELQRNKSVEYGPATEKEPRFSQKCKAILKVADDALVRTICECILNVLKETVPVSKPAKRKLLAHKKSLIALVEKSTPIERKKKILVQQGGNFLSVLLPPLLRVLSSILV